jgi:hypothetical protein
LITFIFRLATFSSMIGWFCFCALVLIQQHENWEDIRVTTPVMTNTKHIIIQCAVAIAVFDLIFLYGKITLPLFRIFNEWQYYIWPWKLYTFWGDVICGILKSRAINVISKLILTVDFTYFWYIFIIINIYSVTKLCFLHVQMLDYELRQMKQKVDIF